MPDAPQCGFECATRPVCYTNFVPHFNASHTLDAIMLNGSSFQRWTRANTQQHVVMGYGDYKNYYEGADLSSR